MKKRHITALITRSLQDFPAILLIGARQVGKSTIAKELVKQGFLNTYITLDDLTTLEAARHDPDGFLTQYDTNTIALDEIQRAPDLLRALKKNIDENRTPGRYLLTGSANILSYPGVAESLAGRMDVIHLEGLSVSEALGYPHAPELINHFFLTNPVQATINHGKSLLNKYNTLNKIDIQNAIFFGGFPEVSLKHNIHFRDRWYSAYQMAYIERDVRDLSKLIDTLSFSKVLRLTGLRTGNLLNISNLAVDAGLDQRTINRYLQLLELTFQLTQLQPWFTNTRKRLVKMPKVFLNDSGLACYLMGIHDPTQLNTHPMLGALFETWVWSEIRKILATTSGIQTSFYRTHQGHEVDFILEKGLSSWGIEIKFAKSISKNDFAGLVDWQSATKHQTYGVIFYQGEEIVQFSESLIAMPLSCLLF